MPKELRNCDYCAGVYTPIRKTSHFCSPECKKKAAWSRKRDEKPRSKDYRKAALTRAVPLNYEQRQMIIGSLLGDGYIAKNNHGHIYKLCHSATQLNYLLWKISLLGGLIQSEPKPYDKLFRGKVNVQYHAHTITHPELTTLREIAYPDGYKHVTEALLSLVDALGLAVWYMDDGSFLKAAASRQVVFCTEGFASDEVVLLRDWMLNRWHVQTVLQPQLVKDGSRFRLRINRTETSKFFSIISQFVPESMLYKLPS